MKIKTWGEKSCNYLASRAPFSTCIFQSHPTVKHYITSHLSPSLVFPIFREFSLLPLQTHRQTFMGALLKEPHKQTREGGVTSECPAQFSVDYGFSCSLTHCSNTIKTTGKHDLSTLSEPIPPISWNTLFSLW